MTKDRLAEMRAISNEIERTGSKEKLKPVKTGSDPMNAFLEQIGSIKLEIQRIQSRIHVLRMFYLQMEKCTTESVRKDLENKVEEEKSIILTAATNTRAALKSVQELFSTKNVTPAMLRMRDTQVNAQMVVLSKAVEDYMECLTSHRERSMQLLKSMIQVTETYEGDDVDSLLEAGKTAFFANNLLMDTLEEKQCAERHEEILKVEKSIKELRDLFAEFALTVNMQGDSITMLAQHVEKSLKKVEKSKTSVSSAYIKAYSRRKRKLLIVGVCVLVIVVLLFLLIILF